MGLSRATAAPATDTTPEATPPASADTLQSRDPAARRRAARALAPCVHTAMAIGTALRHEPDRSVRETYLNCLSALGEHGAVSVLLPLLRGEDASLRNGALEALARMPDAVAQHLDTLLCDPDPDVRILTVNLLTELRHPKVMRWLLDTLERDPEVNVAAASVEVLAEIGDSSALPALRAAQARFHGDAFMGFAIGMALERIGSP